MPGKAIESQLVGKPTNIQQRFVLAFMDYLLKKNLAFNFLKMKSTVHVRTLLLNHNFFLSYFCNFFFHEKLLCLCRIIDSIMLSPFLNVLHSFFFPFL